MEFGTAEMKDYLKPRQGQDVSIDQIRADNNIVKGSKSWKAVPNILFQLEEQKIVRYKSRGIYRVVMQVEAVPVFSVGRERRPPFPLAFPRDQNSGYPMNFEDDVVIREGDLILISGVSNFGKTTLCLNFCGENIDLKPIMMGNEYTVVGDRTADNPRGEYPSPRFVNRLDIMSIANADNGGWVSWCDEDGKDKFALLPVRSDYAEHIVKNRINIIDWINIDTGEHYMIGTVLENIKKQLGRGIAIIAIQKGEGMQAGRGGQFTKDFADVEILIDRFGTSDVLLTLGKVKEAHKVVTGKTYAYSIVSGVRIVNFREVIRCPSCKGTGYTNKVACSMCYGHKFVDGER